MDDFDEFDIDGSVLQLLPWLETPLDAKNNEIRLLDLHKGLEHDPIFCDLRVASLTEQPYYEALSYVWGDATITKEIIIAGQPFAATTNLYNFLCHLRQPDRARVLWVDALCINQSDDKEKQSQIASMRSIYRQSAEALIWLGAFTTSWQHDITTADYMPTSTLTEADWDHAYQRSTHQIKPYIDAGGQFDRADICNPIIQPPVQLLEMSFQVLAELESGKQPAEYPLFTRGSATNRSYALNRSWPVFQDCVRWLLTREYWNRVWTLQEAVLPVVDPQLHIGGYITRLSSLTKGMKAMFSHSDVRMDVNVAYVFQALWLGLPDQTYQEIQDIREYRELSAAEEADTQISIWAAMSSSRNRKATHVRDHFWGFLGLMNDVTREYFDTRDYNLPPGIIFAECSKLLMNTEDGMRAIGDAVGVGHSSVSGLPTWAIDLASTVDEAYAVTEDWQLYNACDDTEPTFSIEFMHEVQGASLILKARYIGMVKTSAKCVSRHSRASQGSVILRRHVSEWYATYEACCRSLGKQFSADAFWRATLMDRNIWRYHRHTRQPLPKHRLEEVQAWWRSYLATDDERDLTADQSAGDGRRGDYHFRAVKWIVDRHRFFCTANGEPGIGPQEVEPDDEIFLLAGCRGLAVLRPVQRDGQRAFLFVGLCFVDGWMYGKGARNRDPKWQDVLLY